MKILMILTSHDQLGNTGKKTGFWLEEFAAPYYVFKDAGAQVTVASPHGGQPPLDPKSDDPSAQTDATRRFKDDPAAQAVLASTQKLKDVLAADFDAVFYPGGHGPLWDLAEDATSIALIEATLAAGKPVAAVCGQRRPVDHWSESSVIRARRRGVAEDTGLISPSQRWCLQHRWGSCSLCFSRVLCFTMPGFV